MNDGSIASLGSGRHGPSSRSVPINFMNGSGPQYSLSVTRWVWMMSLPLRWTVQGLWSRLVFPLFLSSTSPTLLVKTFSAMCHGEGGGDFL